MNVERYMQAAVTTLAPETPLSVVRSTMEDHGYGLLLIADEDGALKGFITRSGLKDVKDWDAPVEKLAHPVRFAVEPEDTLEKAALIALVNRLVLLPVVRDGRLVGVLTQTELLRGLAHGLGIGPTATRYAVTLTAGPSDIYPLMEVLQRHGATVISLVQAGHDGDRCRIILRVQDVADKDKLRQDLEAALHVPDPA